eukprot:CAMPEP_0197717186 /NCGR_PEP_ID=MMETSP1434-20131217/1811_1 /TAXON_ID=265543 /ORGANISM="Minutocellus polymorphus, Strain CCMP3303" /LENGTH=193 /DNA_ID=CAMNT_0043301675 /DNA_START=844 /DNA_END=1424 /DNA_ORIENTATION=+
MTPSPDPPELQNSEDDILFEAIALKSGSTDPEGGDWDILEAQQQSLCPDTQPSPKSRKEDDEARTQAPFGQLFSQDAPHAGAVPLNDAKSEPSTVAEFCTGESVLDALTSHQAIRNRRTFRPSAALDARPARTSSPDDVQDSTETFLAAFVPRAIDRATSAAKRSGSFRETTARVLSSTPLCSRLGPVGEKSD